MAFGSSTFSDIGGAVSDLFASSGDKAKAQGDFIEAKDYSLASDLATQNEKFAETSTAIKQAQLDRSIYQTIGGQQADVAGAGFAQSGSAIDLLRSSAQQGALTKAVAGQQGLIQEAGYKEQAESYANMSQAATIAGNAENDAAKGSMIGGIIKGIAGVASIVAAPFTGGASLALDAAVGLGGILQNSAGDAIQDSVQDAVEG